MVSMCSLTVNRAAVGPDVLTVATAGATGPGPASTSSGAVAPEQQHARRRATSRGDDGRGGADDLARVGVTAELGDGLVDETEAVGPSLGELAPVRVDGKVAVQR